MTIDEFLDKLAKQAYKKRWRLEVGNQLTTGNPLPKGTFVVGNGLYIKCRDCGSIVRVNKPIFGSLHFCILPEERKVEGGCGGDGSPAVKRK